MARISIVGCGFLGSLFMEEWAKRAFALGEEDTVRVIDFDKFEERNAANQNVTKARATEMPMKVTVLEELGKGYGLLMEPIPDKVTKENVEKLLDGTDTLVSALDNIESRDHLWYWAKQFGKPMISLGVSQNGTGAVEWTHDEYCTYSLSPLVRPKDYSEAGAIVTLKPCELVGFRGLGLNVAIAGAKALGLYKGHDPDGSLPKAEVKRGLRTSWSATMTGHTLTEKA